MSLQLQNWDLLPLNCIPEGGNGSDAEDPRNRALCQLSLRGSPEGSNPPTG